MTAGCGCAARTDARRTSGKSRNIYGYSTPLSRMLHCGFVQRILTLLAVLPLLSAAERTPEITTLIYYVNSPSALARLDANAGRISILAPQTFSMHAEGFIGGEVPPE